MSHSTSTKVTSFGSVNDSYTTPGDHKKVPQFCEGPKVEPINKPTMVQGAARNEVPASIVDGIGSEINGPAICIADFKIIKKLGSGTFRRRYLDETEIEAMFEEQSIMRDLSKTPAGKFSHSLEASLHDSHYFYMVSPVMKGGDLWDEIFQHNPKGIHPTRAKHIMAQLVYGLNEMHKVGLLHRDIKPHNVLLDSEGRAYIADFGLSRIFDRRLTGHYLSEPESGKCDVTDKMCGTIGYITPEILLGRQYSYSADTFALGVVMKQLVEGRAPFHGNGEEHHEVVHKTLYENPGMRIGSHVDISAFHLSAAMLNENPRKRITLEGAMRHPYFEGINWKAIAARRPGFRPTTMVSLTAQNVHPLLQDPPQWGLPFLPAQDPFPWFSYKSPQLASSVLTTSVSSHCSTQTMSSSTAWSSSSASSIATSVSTFGRSTEFTLLKCSTMHLHEIARTPGFSGAAATLNLVVAGVVKYFSSDFPESGSF